MKNYAAFIKFFFPIFFIPSIFFPSVSFAENEKILWSEDWERDNWSDDWHADQGTWDAGVITSGPGSAYTGQNCAATVLDGKYIENVRSRFIRHIDFTVPSAEENPHLRFWHWVSNGGGDYGKVQIRVSGNTEWEDIPAGYYSGNKGGVWSHTYLDLSAYADSLVQISFYFYSKPTAGYYGNETNVSSGWYIDDITVLYGGDFIFNNPEDWESGIDDWYVDSGTWQIGVPTSGPDSSYAGQNCAATVLGGNYYEWVSSRLISPLFVVPASDENPRLRFRHWYSFSGGDYGQVQIKTVNSNEWSVLPEGGYSKTSDGKWVYPYLDISAYADSLVQISFYFYSKPTAGYYGNETNVSLGWYIDDVAVEPVMISTEKNVKISSPNGGEQLLPGSSHEITWSYNIVETVTLKYSIDNGTSWTDIATGIDASSKSYVWSVPEAESSQCLIRISDASDDSIVDVSNAIFSIKSPQIEAFFDQVPVQSGGRITVPVTIDMSESSLLLGEYSAILTWQSSHLKFIEATGGTTDGWGDPLLNSDNSEQGELKCSFIYADGSPGKVNILNLTFDVVGSGSDNGTLQLALSSLSAAKTFINLLPFTEITDFTYTISAQSGVTVTAPNGGEVVTAGSPYTITWSSAIAGNVKIEYTTDGGSTWIEITGSTDAAAGEYEWDVPDGESSDCKIRISSTEDSGIFDESDAVFAMSPVGIWGDVNGTGAVNSADGLIIASYGIDIPVGVYEENVLDRGDVNGDGSPDLADGLICARYGIQPDYEDLPALVGQPMGTVAKAAVLPVVTSNETAVPYISMLPAGDDKVIVGTSVGTLDADVPVGAASVLIKWDPSVYRFEGIENGDKSVVINREKTDNGEIRISLIDIYGAGPLSFPPVTLRQIHGSETSPVTVEVLEAVQADTFAKLKVSHEQIASEGNNETGHPVLFGLEQNVPNPFNPSTTINYTLTEPAFVNLNIYNIQGQKIKTLVDSAGTAGFHSVIWNGDDDSGLGVSSGVYIYQLVTPAGKVQKQMLLVR